MKRIIIFLGFSLFLHGIVPMNTWALSCAEPPKPEAALHDYNVVAVATITDIKENFAYKVVKADVITPIKGTEKKSLTFQEDKTWGESEVGKEYLLFLNHSGNALVSPLCSPSKETSSVHHETLIDSLMKEGAKEKKSTPAPTSENTTSEPDKNPDWIMGLILLSCVLSAGIVGIILYQTKKKK